MMEYTWYSVISPESCSSILWRSWDYKERAAEALKLSAPDMLKNGLIDGIIAEPLGGAHNDPAIAYKSVKDEIRRQLKALKTLSADERIETRIDKFSSMGVVMDGE
jgi:acetyl-CoA carboxylase carboxyl transferase subunit alpha